MTAQTDHLSNHSFDEKKAIVFLDLDGTLWDAELIPDSTLEAIRIAKANGHLIFANTGRSKDGARNSLKNIPLSGCVFSAGSEIWLKDTCIFFHPFPNPLAHETFDAIQALDVGFSVEGAEETFSNQKAKDYLYHALPGAADRLHYVHVPDPSAMSEDDFDSVMKFSINHMPKGALDSFFEQHGLILTPFSVQDNPDSICGEVTLKSMNKGTAFASIMDALHKSYRTIAIGDSANDLPMFEAADLSIAMGNGTDEAKEAADYTTASIHDDGLYKAFAYAGLLES